jgi:thiamine pyrophosphate-dependent acetolactate synthase large subunit-like protein
MGMPADKSTVPGWQVVAETLASMHFTEFFYVMGGPTIDLARGLMSLGLRGIDVRHESSAVMMAHAASRRRLSPGLCMAASGPAAANLAPGLANAHVDGAPVLAIAGASPLGDAGRGAFQEFDQFGLLSRVAKHAERLLCADRIAERLHQAARLTVTGRPGPVYVEIPGDILYATTARQDVVCGVPVWRGAGMPRHEDIMRSMELLRNSSRPLVLCGSGVLWSGGGADLARFADASGIPVFTTPQTRGAIPDDHPLSLRAARGVAFRETDLLVVVGTRPNYIWGHLSARTFPERPKVIQIDADPEQLGSTRTVDVEINADPALALQALSEAVEESIAKRFRIWRERLRDVNDERERNAVAALEGRDDPTIHPLSLCLALRASMRRDDVLVVDGQEILTFARQSIPTFELGRRMNSGTFGTMGVGVPYAIGAKVADPDACVILLSGDGALGFSFMELDTAVRHGAKIVVVVSLNGGHTGDPDRVKPGRDLGYTKYHQMAEALGCHAELVERLEELPAALERARCSEVPALVNVVTDWRVRATQGKFTSYQT